MLFIANVAEFAFLDQSLTILNALEDFLIAFPITGCKVRKAYTSLGISCHNAYTKFHCWLLMHICICIEMSHNAYTTTHQCTHFGSFQYKCIYARAVNNGIWCTLCGRKYLNWCTPFWPYRQCYAYLSIWTMRIFIISFCSFQEQIVKYMSELKHAKDIHARNIKGEKENIKHVEEKHWRIQKGLDQRTS